MAAGDLVAVRSWSANATCWANIGGRCAGGKGCANCVHHTTCIEAQVRSAFAVRAHLRNPRYAKQKLNTRRDARSDPSIDLCASVSQWLTTNGQKD